MVGTNTLLSDRYRLGDKIATGGMGTVYRAEDEKLGRTVAIKLLASNLADDSNFVERFRREARASAGLRHPNIANVFDAGDEDDCHFIVMELAEGRDLARVLREDGPLAPERAVNVLGQISLALGHAHAAGIIHRDVKPANVIVDDKDGVKVTDFGIARAADDSKLTMTGSVLGTAHYISPEQAEGRDLSPASDIYSLGIVAFETLTGALPFTGDSLMAVALRHINEEVPPPSAINTSTPPGLDDVVRRATRKNLAERFATTAEFNAALDGSLDTSGPQTAVLPVGAATTEGLATVWPIPGDRWDPVSLGRKVLLVFAFLAFVALALLVWRLASADTPARATRGQGSGAQAKESPSDLGGAANFTISSGVIGMDYRDVQAEITAAGYESEVQLLKDKELVAYLESAGIPVESADAGEVVGTDPVAGEPLSSDQPITLFVSGGLKVDEHGKGHDKGHDKDKGGD
ncbi:MAG: eukaryotic-like serine/threonine-protein kinase [Actinomycetota bacterium]|nr:eukaryotic-like serine/threonine-protein kinase [Actinomycetota bacterium]